MNTLKRLWFGLWENPWQPRYIWPLIIINISGSVLGYFWYGNQLRENPWPLWVLIPDSPLSTTVFAVMLILFVLRSNIPLLTVVGLATTFKYGVWALVILTHYWGVSHDIRPVEVGLWLGHLGMALEAIIFMTNARVTRWALIGGFAWMLLNDFVDYAYGLHPYLFLPSQWTLGLVAAVLLTIISGVLVAKRVTVVYGNNN